MSLVNPIEIEAKKHNKGVLFWGKSGCPPIKNAYKINRSEQCYEFNNWVWRQLQIQPKEVPVVLAGRWSLYYHGYLDPLQSSHGEPLVYFSKPELTQTPEFTRAFEDALVDTACMIAEQREVYLVRPYPEFTINIPKMVSSPQDLVQFVS